MRTKKYQEFLDSLPKCKKICKYCEYSTCFSEDEQGYIMCYADIGEYVNVNDEACPDFYFCDEFPRD